VDLYGKEEFRSVLQPVNGEQPPALAVHQVRERLVLLDVKEEVLVGFKYIEI
jgi:hypothetical protein